MTYQVRFQKRLEFADSDKPLLFVSLRNGTTTLRFEAHLDSGCSKTIFSGDQLEPLGWRQLPAGDPGIGRFSVNSKGQPEILASPLDVELELESGDQFEMTIFGSHQLLNRNLLGRDLLSRGFYGLDVAQQKLYLSSYRDVELSVIFLDSAD